MKTTHLFLNILALVGFMVAVQSAHGLRVKDEQVILDKIEDYELCQKKDYSGDWCHDAMERWVEAHPADAFKAGKMTALKMNQWVAIPFFYQAFEVQKGDCKDEHVQMAVLSALDLPSSSNGETIAQAKKIGISACFNEMKEGLLAKASLNSYMFKNICADLMAKDLLTGLKKKKCAELK